MCFLHTIACAFYSTEKSAMIPQELAVTCAPLACQTISDDEALVPK